MLSVGVTVLGIYVYVKNRSTLVAQPTFVTASTPVDTPVPRRKPRKHRADSTPAPVTSALTVHQHLFPPQRLRECQNLSLPALFVVWVRIVGKLSLLGKVGLIQAFP